MRRGLLDTNMLSYYLKGVPEVVERARRYLSLYGTLEFRVITYYEIVRGLRWANAHRKLKEFERFAEMCVIWDLNRTVAAEAARISAELRIKGVTIEDADIIIAATARLHSLVVVTHNLRHFGQIDHLQIDDWMSAD